MSKLEEATSDESVQLTKNLSERTLDQQANAIRENGQASIELIKVNLLVASLILAILEFGSSSNQFQRDTFVAVSFGALAISIGILTITRFTTSATHWFDSEGLSVIQSDDDSVEVEVISDAYIEWVKENHNRMQKMERRMAISVLLTVFSLGTIIGSVYLLVG